MSPPRTPLRELTTLPSPPSRMGKGTPTAPRSWRITFKLLPPPLCVSHATSQGGLTPCVPQKFWAPPTPSGLTWVLPLWIGCGWPPKTRSSATCCHVKFGHPRSRHTRVIKVIRQKLTSRVLPFKVTQCHLTDTDRLATYDFLLAIISNHGSISYRVRYERRFWTIANFTPLVFNAPAEGVLYGSSAQKTIKMGVFTYSTKVWRTNERTDRQICYNNIAVCMH